MQDLQCGVFQLEAHEDLAPSRITRHLLPEVVPLLAVHLFFTEGLTRKKLHPETSLVLLAIHSLPRSPFGIHDSEYL